MNLFGDLADICRRDVPLGPMTWFGIGGHAEFLIEPKNEQQLSVVLHRCRETQTPVRVLGLGANVLVADEGVRGVVLRLSSDAFTKSTYGEATLTAGGGADMIKLVRESVRRGLAGIEALAGIPGTVGGGICMNCGGKFGEISTVVESIRVISPDGLIRERSKSDLQFGYRRCNLGDELVLSAMFDLTPTDPVALDTRFREIWQYKQATQPPLGTQSAGCIFRNPTGNSAGKLIDQAGLKGFRVGSAWISTQHANFAIADKGGRASDVIRLITTVADRVADTFGVRLEPEVKIW